MAKRYHIKPYSFRNRTLSMLLLCTAAAGLISLLFTYLYSTILVIDEFKNSQHDTAIYMLGLDQITELSTEDIISLTVSENSSVAVTVVTDSVTSVQLGELARQPYLELTDNRRPAMLVELTEDIVRLEPAAWDRLYGVAFWRIFATVLIFLGVFVSMTFLASWWISHPISKLTHATRQISRGDFSVQITSRHTGEVGELVNSFNTMTAALQRTAYIHKDFISSISHEFRTPIASIRGFARLLQMPGLDQEQQQEYVGHIATESDRLSRLSETLLRLTALERQSSPAETTAFSLDEQVRQVILRLEPAWSARDIDWQLSLDSVTVESDAELLTQVWINLIHNAVKFSPVGGAIEIRVYQEEHAVFEITDHGIGMDEETLSRIFDHFYQADQSRAKEGVGLGLCLVKRILDMLGGAISVTSTPGEGSTFRVALPSSATIIKER